MNNTYRASKSGTICHSDVSAFVVTPVCPHSLTNRPLIFPDHLQLVIKLKEGEQKATLTVDGETVAEISDKHKVVIEKHKQAHFVLKKPSHNYFTLLNEKLNFSQRNVEA